ncbi:SLC13 family permease [Fodinibius sediminis]|uniref:Di-and tricarboxylate transporter n=1 Tax=Fodinibius sediminis TaxID=1214077 RepID=A0A521AGG0_9BACT|nr:SLC13 family permease [Fodinibius sediminis]SMO33891.1 Di-and tricarboxylate transporter [Fodinibius sediminis]
MSFEIIFVFFLLAAALALFSTDYVSFDIAALLIMISLLATGILSPSEGLAGFSNPATLTVAAMFVLSEGLRRTGLLNTIGQLFTERIKENYWGGLIQMLLFISFCSAFINNTAVVVIFIPIVIHIANRIDVSPSKLLMPLSFAGIFGGTCTLIGTSTNILVSSIAQDQGMEPFSMFSFAPVGLMFLASGFIYLFVYGIPRIPARREHKQLTKGYKMQEYLTDVVVTEESDLAGHIFHPEELTNALDLDVLRIFKPDSDSSAQRNEVKIEAGDILRIRGSAKEIDKLLKSNEFMLKPAHEWTDTDLMKGRDALVEAVIAPESSLIGKTLESVDFFERFGAVPLAVRQHGELQQEKLGKLKLEGGSTILLSMSKDRVQEVDRNPSFIVASEIGEMRSRPDKTFPVLAIMLGVVAAAALNIVPIVVSALAGVALMVLTGCISAEEAYQAVNWKVIILLAGVIPLGTAMNKTGAASLMADQMIFWLSGLGPRAVLSGFFGLTMGITAIMSNNASAALLAPIAIQTAQSLDVNAYPFLFAVTFAASLSFITPFGYQTNTLIYGAGKYEFTDFTKIGLPLNILFWILATIFIPVIWPF